MRKVRLALTIMVLLCVTASGRERRAILGSEPDIAAVRISLDPSDPTNVKIGALTYLGGVALSSRDGAFGGFSSLSVEGDRFTLLSDGGTVVRFRLDADFRISGPWFGDLPGGPGLGWEKRDRDSESMTVDPESGHVWVGFERANQIWRYARDLGAPPPASVRPRWRGGRAMAAPNRWQGCMTDGFW